jgi:hypothetical protein
MAYEHFSLFSCECSHADSSVLSVDDAANDNMQAASVNEVEVPDGSVQGSVVETHEKNHHGLPVIPKGWRDFKPNLWAQSSSNVRGINGPRRSTRQEKSSQYLIGQNS